MAVDSSLFEALAEKYGTPLHVIDMDGVRRRYVVLRDVVEECFSEALICYALKANPLLRIVEELSRLGAGAEVVSGGELHVSLNAGVPPEKIVFNGVAKTSSEILEAVETNVRITNVEMLDELREIEKACSGSEAAVTVGARVNLDVKAHTHPYTATGERIHKFGMDPKDAISAFKTARKMRKVRLVGLHCHIGSQILDLKAFKTESEKIIEFISHLRRMKTEIEIVDVGGGLGIDYSGRDRAPSVEAYAEAYTSVVNYFEAQGLKEPTMIFEPGRYLVAEAGTLLAQVVGVKNVRGRRWAVVDAGMNELIRPALYGSSHRIVNLSGSGRRKRVYAVGGPICESADVFSSGTRLREVKKGDLVGIMDTGAYSTSMSSQYNSRPRAAVVVVEVGGSTLARRRETYEDLIRLDEAQ